ncbi:MAG: hypothetical protein WBF53_16430 [Litorimonas sp.]
MLRLLVSTAAILPIGVISWMSSTKASVEPVAVEETYAELVTDPQLDALSDCEAASLPIFFDEEDVTVHSAEFIQSGLEAAEDCGPLDVTLVPVVPEAEELQDLAESDARIQELAEQVTTSASFTHADIDMDVAEDPREEEVATLYINGRAAIVRIDPAE